MAKKEPQEIKEADIAVLFIDRETRDLHCILMDGQEYVCKGFPVEVSQPLV